MKRLTYVIALLLVFASCTGENKGIETTTPEPLEEISVAMDGGKLGTYLLTIGQDGKGLFQELDQNNNVVNEEAVTVLVTNGKAEFNALGVHVTLQVDENMNVTAVTMEKDGVTAAASIMTEPIKVTSFSGEALASAEVPKWVMASLSRDHTCAIRDDTEKTVWCWGSNAQGQMGSVTKTNKYLIPKKVDGVTGAVYIKADTERACVVVSSGDVFCWGNSNNSNVVFRQFDNFKNVASLSFVGNHLYAIKNDGKAFYADISSNLPDIAVTDVTANQGPFKEVIALPNGGAYLLKNDSKIIYIKSSAEKVNSFGGNTVHITAYEGSPACEIDFAYGKGYNDVSCWNAPLEQPVKITDTDHVISFAVGGDDKWCAVKDDNTLWCLTYKGLPALKMEIDPVKSVYFGKGHACAIDTSGYLWSWGNNASGQLGDGTTDAHDLPKKIK